MSGRRSSTSVWASRVARIVALFFLFQAKVVFAALSFSISPSSINLTQSVTLTVKQPTVTISVSPSTINLTQSATLTWSTTNANSCTASGAWTGSQSTSGTSTVTPTTAGPYTYTLTCNGVASSTTLTVLQPTVSISASPTSISSGGTSTL